ncbi:cyclase family protein [Salmonirosea aquatica]|uniref:Cyclase family protein n=1 Tax=Salmonirosea aquatica TaxID=2654236 RepID=A0A7C9F928_9BACT|nr:cyclase family protein [Cytophagaceae bacterium SJW1-29]
MHKTLYALSLLAVGCTQQPAEQAKNPFSSGQWIDLSYEFSDETPYWPTSGPFRLNTDFEGITPGGYYYSAYNFCAAEHGGTHLDAPVHFAEGKWSTEQIPLENLTGDAVVIDVSEKARTNSDYQVTVGDIEAWEKTNGPIPDQAIVLFRTGHGTLYPDAKNYLGTDERGAEAVAKLHFPGIDPEAAEWLVGNRKIKAVGIDTASIDFGQSKDFKTHQLFYGANIPGFENVANLDKVPTKGAYVVALPMKIKGGSGAPLRIVAWLQD